VPNDPSPANSIISAVIGFSVGTSERSAEKTPFTGAARIE
jgi:hypothetical protein